LPSNQKGSSECLLLVTIVSLVQDVSLLVIDEHMLEYQPKKEAKARQDAAGEPIPVTHIPRKPHPNGLIAYPLATFVPHPVQSPPKKILKAFWK
jgi:hypothetical protein